MKSRLTFIKKLEEKNNRGRYLSLFKCSCGSFVKKEKHLAKRYKSCGCLQKETVSKTNKKHGLSNTPTYYSWQGMKDRCLNPNRKDTNSYYNKGITIDPNWVNSFDNFVKDMGIKPANTELERINNNLGYNKQNCYWKSHELNCQNRQTTKLNKDIVKDARLRFSQGETIRSIAQSYNVNETTLAYAIHKKTWKNIQ